MKTCSMCGDDWPETREFYFSAGGNSLRADCKACYLERRKERKRGR